MKGTLFILCSFIALRVGAFHIVGGEMEFIYLFDGVYRVNMIIYIDEVQEGNPNDTNTPADRNVTVYLYRKRDDVLVEDFTLRLIRVEDIPYTNIDCVRGELQTSRAFYSGTILLDPFNFTSEEGYYIVWERCCRNTTIKNIVSPETAGITYVLEIPPLVKNGNIFRNSSPILPRPLGEYACINQLYYVDFAGVDLDNDSLVYSLTTPLNSSTTDAVPDPSPKPHIEVRYSNGFSSNNVIPGNPNLQISSDGLLTVSPSETGLFVFSVKVEEYRANEKIGETRRDFQMLVLDGCTPPNPPSVAVDIPGNPDFDPENDTLTYTVGESKCFSFQVENVSMGETITLRAQGVNFNNNIDNIFELNQIRPSERQLNVEICIPDCPPVRNEPFILDLIASDDACPLPQLDIVRLTVEVEPPSNTFPNVSSISNFDLPEDSVASKSLTARDNESDAMVATVIVEGFDDPRLVGFRFDTLRSEKGRLTGNLVWDTNCRLYDFSDQTEFTVGILIEDLDTCSVANDTVFINAKVTLPPNNDPVVSVSNGELLSSEIFEIDLGETLSFDVLVDDPDRSDLLTLYFRGGNFNADNYTIEFEPQSGSGNISTPFSWTLPCDAGSFQDGQIFELWFIADDLDKCKVKNFDTLKLPVKVNYPENAAPEFTDIPRNQRVKAKETIRIPVEAFDPDNDNVTLSFATGILPPPSASLSFNSATGRGSVKSVIEWTPECSLIRFGQTTATEEIFLQVTDDACPIPNIDTIKLTFEIVDEVNRMEDFLPPNIFTPNGDGVNDRFTLFNNPNINQNIPPDNCDSVFEYVVIVNRAGSEVFRSTGREFSWTGDDYPAGVYYLLVKFTNTEYKGYIHLIR